VLQAFGRGDEYMYRFGGLKVNGQRAVITVRESHGGFGQPSVPFDIEIEWTPKTTIKAILAAMRAGAPIEPGTPVLDWQWAPRARKAG